MPRDVTEEDLRPLFEPYGDIEHINILRTHRGQSAGEAPCTAFHRSDTPLYSNSSNLGAWGPACIPCSSPA